MGTRRNYLSMTCGRLLWVLVALLFLSDLALPMAPGAFQPLEPGQSVEVARRSAAQTVSAGHPPSLHPRLPAIAQRAQRRPMVHAPRREATAARSFVVLLIRSSQNDSVALTSSEDPA